MSYPHLGGKLPTVLRPGNGRHLSDLIVNVPTLIILAALVYAALLARKSTPAMAGAPQANGPLTSRT
jgi:hypothetical protein